MVPIYMNWIVKLLADMEKYLDAIRRIERDVGVVDNIPSDPVTMSEESLKGIDKGYDNWKYLFQTGILCPFLGHRTDRLSLKTSRCSTSFDRQILGLS